jgi:Na+/glutamate symporter
VKLEFNLLYTLLIAMVMLFIGRALVEHVGWLKRFSIPAPVVGGCLIAVVLAAAVGFAGTTVSFDGGSITLTGGHGTGGAYATRFGETMNLQGASRSGARASIA